MPPGSSTSGRSTTWCLLAPSRDAKGKVAEPGSVQALRNGVLVQQNAHFTESVLHGQTMGLHLQGYAREPRRHLPRVGPPKNLPAPSRRCSGWGVMHTNNPQRNTLTVHEMGWQRFRESPCRPTSARWPCGRRREIVEIAKGEFSAVFLALKYVHRGQKATPDRPRRPVPDVRAGLCDCLGRPA